MRKLPVFTILASAAALAFVPAAAHADRDFPCPPTVAGFVPGNLVVPPGAFCVFGPGTVAGNVIARADSNVVLRDVTVNGNVETDRADALWITNLTDGAPANLVRGNIHIVGGGPSAVFFHEVVICNTRVEHGNVQIEKRTGSILAGHTAACGNRVERGNIKVEDNVVQSPDMMQISFNEMAWNLQVFKNVGTGFKFVQDNVHHGALQCKENAPPFFGGPNHGPGPDDPNDQCFDVLAP